MARPLRIEYAGAFNQIPAQGKREKRHFQKNEGQRTVFRLESTTESCPICGPPCCPFSILHSSYLQKSEDFVFHSALFSPSLRSLSLKSYFCGTKEDRAGDGYQWGQFSLDSAMRGIAEEPSPFAVRDIKEKF